MRLLITISIICIAINLPAQRVIDLTQQDVSINMAYFTMGKSPVALSKYVKIVDGTPYYNAEWMKGKLLLKDSTEYINIFLRLDLLSEAVEFKDATGAEFIATQPIQELTLIDTVALKSYRFIHSSSLPAAENKQNGWYQVLVNGKATLYKFISKVINESKPYNSATFEQRIVSQDHYYFQKANQLVRIKKIKDLPGLLITQQREVAAFIDANKLNGKKESDFTSLFLYYNSLPAK